MTLDIVLPVLTRYMSQMWCSPWTYTILGVIALVYCIYRLGKLMFDKLNKLSGWIFVNFSLPHLQRDLSRTLGAARWQADNHARLFWDVMMLQISTQAQHPVTLLASHQLAMLRTNYAEFYVLYGTRGLWMQQYVVQASNNQWVNLDRTARLADLRRVYRRYCFGSGMLSRRRSLQEAGIPVEYLTVPFEQTRVDAVS